MVGPSDWEHGKELEEEIAEGFITEADLTESGKRRLAVYRAAPETKAVDTLEEGLAFLGLSGESHDDEPNNPGADLD